jgi:hypothetical protein
MPGEKTGVCANWLERRRAKNRRDPEGTGRIFDFPRHDKRKENFLRKPVTEFPGRKRKNLKKPRMVGYL